MRRDNSTIREQITCADSASLARVSANGRAARRASRRPPMVNPATCERQYSDDETEYLRAIEDYQKRTGVRFPTHCEYRNVLMSLGYAKVTA